MAGRSRPDLAFTAELRAAARSRPRIGASMLLVTIAAFLAAAIAWASQARLDEAATGQGRVVPSSQIQIVQNLEGGILAEILVREGDIVADAQVLLRIDDTSFGANLRENQARYFGLQAKVARLEGEINGSTPSFPADIEAALAADEMALYRSRRAELEAAVGILEQQAAQRRQELVELASRIDQLSESHRLAAEELGIMAPLVAEGVTSRVELLRLERQVNDIEGEREASRLAIPRVQSGLAEAERRIAERREAFRGEALEELNEARVRLRVLGEAARAAEDKVRRTEVRSPVHGTVKRILINTLGGVIQPGMDLVEIVPLEDTLLVEAEIRPADIAFLRPGQDANVKITAYDFASYGGLEAELEHISADTIVNEAGESFYRILVRTRINHLGTAADPLPIIPGMVAEVDIMTGSKTVLEYILNPINRARERALRER